MTQPVQSRTFIAQHTQQIRVSLTPTLGWVPAPQASENPGLSTPHSPVAPQGLSLSKAVSRERFFFSTALRQGNRILLTV